MPLCLTCCKDISCWYSLFGNSLCYHWYFIQQSVQKLVYIVSSIHMMENRTKLYSGLYLNLCKYVIGFFYSNLLSIWDYWCVNIKLKIEV